MISGANRDEYKLQNRLFVNGVDFDLSGDLQSKNINMFTIIGINLYKDTSRTVNYSNSSTSVVYQSEKITFGEFNVTDGEIKFVEYENSSALDDLLSEESANVSTPNEFKSRIKKIGKTDIHLAEKMTQGESSIITILYDYGSGSDDDNGLIGVAFDNTDNNFDTSNIYKKSFNFNVANLSELSYSVKNENEEYDYFLIEDSLVNQRNGNDRAKALGFDITYPVVVTDECNFIPPTPTATRTTSYTPSPSPTETPTPSCDLTFPHDMDTESIICDLNDPFKLEFTFEGYSKSPSLGGRAIYKASNKYTEKVVYYNHDLNRWIYESKILTSTYAGQIKLYVSAQAICAFNPWEATWIAEGMNWQDYTDSSTLGNVDFLNYDLYLDGTLHPLQGVR